jgi:hypothetical protein
MLSVHLFIWAFYGPQVLQYIPFRGSVCVILAQEDQVIFEGLFDNNTLVEILYIPMIITIIFFSISTSLHTHTQQSKFQNLCCMYLEWHRLGTEGVAQPLIH